MTGVSNLAFMFPYDSPTRYGYIEQGIQNTYLIYEVDNDGNVISDVFVFSGGKLDKFRGSITFAQGPGYLVEKLLLADITDTPTLLDKYRLLPLKGHKIRLTGAKRR